MSMRMGLHFEETVSRIKQKLLEDPRPGSEKPRDYEFTVRVVDWIKKITVPSEALLLAAWGHVLCRWEIFRDTYPMNTGGYHKWRKALAILSSQVTGQLMRETGYDEVMIQRVQELVLKKTFPQDPEACVLEDATCLVFLETKLEEYIPAWDEEKTMHILRGTLEKMTPAAIELAKKISYSPAAASLITKAIVS